jgi:hypothetical protein
MKERKDLQKNSAAMMKMRTPLNMINDDKKKTITYDGGYEAPGMHNQATKTVVKEKDSGYDKHGDFKRKTVTKKTFVNDDTPYGGRKGQYGDVKGGKQTLTKTKTIDKGQGGTSTKTKEKGISNKRAARIKNRIRKHDASTKTNPYSNR